VNLETLMVTAYNMKLKDTPFSRIHTLPVPKIPDIPFKPDLSTIERLRQKFSFFEWCVTYTRISFNTFGSASTRYKGRESSV